MTAGGIVRPVPLRPPAQGPGAWTFDPAELRAAVTARTKILLLNTPHNPTGKVFRADELRLLAGQRVEGTVAHRQPVVLDDRLVAVLRQRVGHSPGFSADPGERLAGCATPRSGLRAQPLLEGTPVERPGGGRRQDRADQVVLASGQRDADLHLGAAVELRGPAGPRAGAPGEPTSLGAQQAFLDQALQVEPSRVPGDGESSCHLFPSDGQVLGGDVLVDRAAHGIGQGAECTEAICGHWSSLTGARHVTNVQITVF